MIGSTPVVRLERKFFFEASHRLFVPSLTEDENRALFGRRAGRFGHGHNYEGSVTAIGPIDPRTEFLVNIADLDREIRAVAKTVDHKYLNLDVEGLRGSNPTCEQLAQYLFECFATRLPVERLELIEDVTTTVEYFGEGCPMLVTRCFTFSAAHRLQSARLSKEENEAVFGKCNNPYGHGHDYRIEVTVEGSPDPVTGLVAPLGAVEAVVDREVVEPMDCRHLNEEVEEFRTLNPTSENLAVVIWNRLDGRLPAKLHRVRLWETRKSCFEYRGE
ncbi:MAG: 6-carboxytetrahydropterin synthase [Acidobacteriota bacterium]